MKRKIVNFSLLILLLFCVSFSSAFAQKYTTSSKKAIKLYDKANEYFRARRFDEGIAELQKAIRVDENFAEAHYRLATTFQLLQYNAEALKYFQETIRAAPDDPKFKGAYYYLCLYYISKGKYDEARQTGEKFLALNPAKDKFITKIKKVVADCNYAEQGMKNPLDFKSQPLSKPLNQFYLQYFPALTGDQNTIVFTARSTPPRNSYDSDENLYVSYKKDGQWTDPESISANINSAENEGTASISADGKVLVFTSCDRRSRENYGQCDLFISYKQGDTWSEPINLGPNINSPQWESQPSLSADGKTIYFISTRPGGKGGKDIWSSTLGEDDQWRPAQNLEINTPMEEVSPFIHPNSKTLFFGSDGYPGYGGYDLYTADYVNKEWTEPRNLGYPVNTYEDQLALFISTDGQKGYYSLEETENGRYISSVLHEFDVPESIQPKFKSNYVKGYVYDSQTKEKLEAEIELFDLTDDIKQASVNSDGQNGEYLIVISEGSEYALEVSKKGYAFKSLTFNYTEGKDVEPLEINIPLDPITKGTTFRLNNIFFDYNKYELQEKSKTELDELVKFMTENPEVKGEIAGHTDNIGTPAANKELSLNRAKSVYDYLVEAGVASERLSYQGYGETRPQAKNDTEEGRALNRRIEFEIK